MGHNASIVTVQTGNSSKQLSTISQDIFLIYEHLWYWCNQVQPGTSVFID